MPYNEIVRGVPQQFYFVENFNSIKRVSENRWVDTITASNRRSPTTGTLQQLIVNDSIGYMAIGAGIPATNNVQSPLVISYQSLLGQETNFGIYATIGDTSDGTSLQYGLRMIPVQNKTMRIWKLRV